jgi:hypothetical protein
VHLLDDIMDFYDATYMSYADKYSLALRVQRAEGYRLSTREHKRTLLREYM